MSLTYDQMHYPFPDGKHSRNLCPLGDLIIKSSENDFETNQPEIQFFIRKLILKLQTLKYCKPQKSRTSVRSG